VTSSILSSTQLATLVGRWSRREFVSQTGLALIACAIGGCGSDAAAPTAPDDEPDPPPPAAPPAGLPAGVTLADNRLLIALNANPALRSAGGLLTINRTELGVQVLVMGLGDTTFVALTSVCTHSGCSNRWMAEAGNVVCGCHGSTFNPAGGVVNGPATDPLRAFAVRYLAPSDAVEVTLA
jgi:cytochrome b6-f complex iron-sulfur subunit